MNTEFRCSAAARAACEFSETCGEDATFFEGSECHKFNEEIKDKARMKPVAESTACKHTDNCGHDICMLVYCDEYEPKKMTNGDRIRAMSDRELARFLCDLRKDCYECPAESFCHKVHTGMQDWLKQPAEGGLT